MTSDPTPAVGWDCHVHVFGSGGPAPGAHYEPVPRPIADIETLAQAHGCGRLVLVQPSVYGSDNTLMLQALRAARGRHRGVVVLQGNETDGELDAMHAAGVRGMRFNLVSPVGSDAAAVAGLLERLAPALRRRGWHVQCYVHPAKLPEVVEWQASSGLPFVLDHLAGLTPAQQGIAGCWLALEALAGAGAWIKLSGWYRLQAGAPYAELQPLVERTADVFGERMVWGSDWPHTSFAPGALPPYDSLWQPVVRALGEARAQRVRAAGERLYS
jgi:predicted TIM-barrel fold metal-dependent hydrolase